MKRVDSAALVVLFAFMLVGCGVAAGTMKTVGDKEFAFSEVSKVKVGMKEAQIIELLGRPTAFGVDEQGREYLHYHRTSLSIKSAMAIGPGAGGATASQAAKGFEVRIHLKDGVVQSIAHTLYQGAEERAR